MKCDCNVCQLSNFMESKRYEGDFMDLYHTAGLDKEYDLYISKDSDKVKAQQAWDDHFNYDLVEQAYAEWKRHVCASKKKSRFLRYKHK